MKTLLIKIGGSENIQWNTLSQDIARIAKKQNVIIVHGASKTRDKIAVKLGQPTITITSPSGIESVYSNEDAIDIFLMSYCGLVNKKIVAALQKHNINAVGLSGIDGRLWEGKRKHTIYATSNGKTKLISDSYTGKVEKININLISLLVKNNFIPVICPPAISYEGEIINTDNDSAVAVMAKYLHIEKIVFLFEATGLLKNIKDPKSLIRKIPKSEIDEYMQFAKGRMKKKLMGAKIAFEAGAKSIYFGDVRIKKPVTSALKGLGTQLS